MPCFDTFRGFLHKLYAATMDGKGRESTISFSHDDWGRQGAGHRAQGAAASSPCHPAGASHAEACVWGACLDGIAGEDRTLDLLSSSPALDTLPSQCRQWHRVRYEILFRSPLHPTTLFRDSFFPWFVQYSEPRCDIRPNDMTVDPCNTLACPASRR